MNRDTMRGLMGRIGSRVLMLQALSAALHIIEALWYTMKADEREKARKICGFDAWVKTIIRAVDWS